jgi:SAM-dependent methyltransferase
MARVTGLDYSETGIAKQKKFFINHRIKGDSVCEDIFSYTYSENIFDLVYSLGVIEHYDDPTFLIEAHLRLAKPGGLVVIAIPNYSGKHLTLQSIFDSENLKIHNLNLMSKVALERCAPKAGISDLRVYPFGRFDPGLINLNNRLTSVVTKPLFHFATLLSHLMPEKLHRSHAMWVMSFRKALI